MAGIRHKAAVLHASIELGRRSLRTHDTLLSLSPPETPTTTSWGYGSRGLAAERPWRTVVGTDMAARWARVLWSGVETGGQRPELAEGLTLQGARRRSGPGSTGFFGSAAMGA